MNITRLLPARSQLKWIPSIQTDGNMFGNLSIYKWDSSYLQTFNNLSEGDCSQPRSDWDCLQKGHLLSGDPGIALWLILGSRQHLDTRSCSAVFYVLTSLTQFIWYLCINTTLQCTILWYCSVLIFPLPPNIYREPTLQIKYNCHAKIVSSGSFTWKYASKCLIACFVTPVTSFQHPISFLLSCSN